MNTKPYKDIGGVYNPVKLRVNKQPSINVSASSSARLYKRSKRKPNVYMNAIKGEKLTVKPSFFSNFGI